MKNIDAKGMMCPGPVIAARRVLLSGEDVCITVDNDGAVENLCRLGASMGCEAAVAGYRVTLSQKGETVVDEICGMVGDTVYMFADDKLGGGDEKLGQMLIKMALYTLANAEKLPGALVFINRGVLIPCSEHVADICALADAGVKILVCGTCLDHYGRTDALKCGIISNMYEILEVLAAGSKVIRL